MGFGFLLRRFRLILQIIYSYIDKFSDKLFTFCIFLCKMITDFKKNSEEVVFGRVLKEDHPDKAQNFSCAVRFITVDKVRSATRPEVPI